MAGESVTKEPPGKTFFESRRFQMVATDSSLLIKMCSISGQFSDVVQGVFNLKANQETLKTL